MPVHLSVVIPAFNEEQRLSETLPRIADYFQRAYPGDHEILVVDDGSTDCTGAVVQRYLPKASWVRLNQNRGKGAAIRHGLQIARGNRLLVIDADLATPLSEYQKLSHLLDSGSQIAIGSRAAPGGVNRFFRPKHRKPDEDIVEWQVKIERFVSGRVFAWFTHLLLGLDIADTQCGFKMFTAQAVRQLLPLCRVDRYAFDVEILFRAKQLGIPVTEIAVRWQDQPGSKVNVIKDGLEMLSSIISLRLEKVQLPLLQRVFFPLFPEAIIRSARERP